MSNRFRYGYSFIALSLLSVAAQPAAFAEML